jgi:hypothetical protein
MMLERTSSTSARYVTRTHDAVQAHVKQPIDKLETRSRIDVTAGSASMSVPGPKTSANGEAPTQAPRLVREAGKLVAKLGLIPADERADEVLTELFQKHAPNSRPSRLLSAKR